MFAKLEAAAAGDPDWLCVNVALGAKPGRAQLNRAGMGELIASPDDSQA